MFYGKRSYRTLALALVVLTLLGCGFITDDSAPAATNTAAATEPPAAATPTAEEELKQIQYMADLNSAANWISHPSLTVGGGELVFSPTAFEQAWAKDFSEVLGDFVLSATFSYDTAGIDEYGVAIVIGDPIKKNFYFLGVNPYQGDTLWFFVMVKNNEYIHPTVSPPMTKGQPDEFTVELRRVGKRVTAYVNGKVILERDDIVFDGKPAKMRVGVHGDGNQDTIYLHELTVSTLGEDLAATPQVAPQASGAGSGSFAGQMLNHESKAAVPGAGIVLCLDTGDSCTIDAVLSAETGSDGEFEIEDIPPGKYIVLYNPDGILYERVDGMVVEIDDRSAACIAGGFFGSAPTDCQGSVPFMDDPNLTLKANANLVITGTGMSLDEGSIFSPNNGLHMDFKASKPLGVEIEAGQALEQDLLVWSEW